MRCFEDSVNFVRITFSIAQCHVNFIYYIFVKIVILFYKMLNNFIRGYDTIRAGYRIFVLCNV